MAGRGQEGQAPVSSASSLSRLNALLFEAALGGSSWACACAWGTLPVTLPFVSRSPQPHVACGPAALRQPARMPQTLRALPSHQVPGLPCVLEPLLRQSFEGPRRKASRDPDEKLSAVRRAPQAPRGDRPRGFPEPPAIAALCQGGGIAGGKTQSWPRGHKPAVPTRPHGAC